MKLKKTMINDVDIHILEMNYLETIISYLEGRKTLAFIFALNERILKRPEKSLSKQLINGAKTINELKTKIKRGEEVDKYTITNTICDVMLKLSSPH